MSETKLTGWQPIETAPKDGTEIDLTWMDDGKPAEIYPMRWNPFAENPMVQDGKGIWAMHSRTTGELYPAPKERNMAERLTAQDGAYHGHKTLADGTHVALSADEAKALWEACEAARAKTEADMPTEQSALNELSRAFHRLKDFGWREAIYCPKDGGEFEVIEAGSTGIFRCRYDGKWPDGMWMTFDEGDVYPSSRGPLMFRLLPEAQAEYDRKMREAAEQFTAARQALRTSKESKDA